MHSRSQYKRLHPSKNNDQQNQTANEALSNVNHLQSSLQNEEQESFEMEQSLINDGPVQKGLNINSKMVEDRQVIFKPNWQQNLEVGGRNGSTSHCSQKSIERYSSQKKRGGSGIPVQPSHQGRVLQYNEYHDETTHSNNSPDQIVLEKRESPKIAQMHQMETFQKNDSSPGMNTRQSECKFIKDGPNQVSSPIRTQEITSNINNFEQNLDFFINKFKQTHQFIGNFKLESQMTAEDENENELDAIDQKNSVEWEGSEVINPNEKLLLSNSQRIMKDSLSSSGFKQQVKAPPDAKNSKTTGQEESRDLQQNIGAQQVRKGKHKRYETQIQTIKEEYLDKNQKLQVLLNSETKNGQNETAVKNISDIIDDSSNSNQSSVARFGFKSSNIRLKNELNSKKLSGSISKNSKNEVVKQPGEGQGAFDASQRSTMMQGVNGSNYAEKIQSVTKQTQGEANEIGKNQSRFKASPRDNIESDHETAIEKANRTKERARQNLQKLLIDEREQEEEESSTGQNNSNEVDAMDQMINKQSFSVNPRVLKKSSSNSGGGEPSGGNFMQILCQYTQEQDTKQGHTTQTSNHLVVENEALSKQNENLKQQIADKEKQISDLEIQLKYEKIQSFKHQEKCRRERHNMKKLLHLLEKRGLKSYVKYCIRQQNNEITSKMRQSQTSNLSRYSVTSFPIFGSEYGGGLTASALSKNSRMSNSQFSRSKSISPVNAIRFKTFHYKKRGHSFSNQTNVQHSHNNLFQTSGNTTHQKNFKQKYIPNVYAPDSLGELSSSQNIKQRPDAPPYMRHPNNAWQTKDDQSVQQNQANDQFTSNHISHHKLGNSKKMNSGGHNKSVQRGNKQHISRTMGPSTPVQELIAPIDMVNIKDNCPEPNVISRNDLSSQRGYQIDSSTNFADHIIAQSSMQLSNTNMNNNIRQGGGTKAGTQIANCYKPPRTSMNQYPAKNNQRSGMEMLTHEVSLSQKNESSNKNQEGGSLKQLSKMNQHSLNIPPSSNQQMLEGLYRTQQASTKQYNRLSNISGQNKAQSKNKTLLKPNKSMVYENMKPIKQSSMIQKMNRLSNIQGTDGSVLYSDRQNNQISQDFKINVVHGFEEHVDPDSSRNNTNIASQVSSIDPDNQQNKGIYPQPPSQIVQSQFQTITNGSSYRVYPQQNQNNSLSALQQYQNFIAEPLSQIQNESRQNQTMNNFKFNTENPGQYHDGYKQITNSTMSCYNNQTMTTKTQPSLIEKFKDRKNSQARNQSSQSRTASINQSSMDCRQQILQSLNQVGTQTQQSVNNTNNVPVTQNMSTNFYSLQSQPSQFRQSTLESLIQDSTEIMKQYSQQTYGNQQVHPHQAYLNQQNRWDPLNNYNQLDGFSQEKRPMGEINYQNEMDQQLQIHRVIESEDSKSNRPGDVNHFNKGLIDQINKDSRHSRSNQQIDNHFIQPQCSFTTECPTGPTQRHIGVSRQQTTIADEKDVSMSNRKKILKGGKYGSQSIIFTSQSEGINDQIKGQKDNQKIKNQKVKNDNNGKPRGGVQMETQHSEFNYNNLFMTTEANDQEVEKLGSQYQRNLIQNDRFCQQNINENQIRQDHSRVQLEAVCEEMSSYLQSYRSGLEGNPPNSMIIQRESNRSSDLMTNELNNHKQMQQVPFNVAKSKNNKLPNQYIKQINNKLQVKQQKPPIIISNAANQVKPPISANGKQQNSLPDRGVQQKLNQRNNSLSNLLQSNQNQFTKPNSISHTHKNSMDLKNGLPPSNLVKTGSLGSRSKSGNIGNNQNYSKPPIMNMAPPANCMDQYQNNFQRGKKLTTNTTMRPNTLNSAFGSEQNLKSKGSSYGGKNKNIKLRLEKTQI